MNDNPFYTLVNTLEERTSKVKVHNPKAHMGEKWLRTTSTALGDNFLTKMIGLTLHTLTSRFTSDSGQADLGHAMAAELIINIGRNAETYIEEPTNNIHLHASIGAALVAVFLNEGYVDLYRDPAYSENAKTAPYLVAATDKFNDLREIPEEIIKDLIRATVTEMPDSVTSMVQPHGRSIIKGYNEQQEEEFKFAVAENLEWIQAVNALQQQAWRINRDVFAVVERNFEKLMKPVGNRPGLVSANDVKLAFEALKANDTQVNRDKYNRVVKLWNKELEVISAASKNVERETIRKKAKALVNLPVFYQYVELDYRGRVYYQEPLLNYQGPDLARGILEFAEGKPLGDTGVQWLAIHTANSFNKSYGIDEIPEWVTYDYKTMLQEQQLDSISVDKMTLRDREMWTWENMDMILASTDTIHSGKDCEKPIGFLACCIEWARVAEDGFDTISHLPVAIDGSCNGYQHSAAIAKDEITGSLVSLTKQPVQADLYLTAAQELIKRMPDFFAARPDMKMKHIRKGIAKRGVMTRAYSAGKDKMADSMYKDCHQEGYTDKFDITMLDCIELADNLYELIKDVCPGATKTMKYLQHLATYELGKMEFFATDGTKVSKSKRTKLHRAKSALKKIKAADITDEELAELNRISDELDSHTLECTHGNGMRQLEWITPSGFRVNYEAWKQTSLKLDVTFPGWDGGQSGQSGRVRFSVLEDTPYPDIQAFQSGISPNFIHSMDATHMAQVIASWDGSFGAVHDSFSAHACDIGKLSEMTREKFVELYDVDDTYAWLAEMILSPCVYDEELPDMGQLEIEEVRNSTYFFC